MHHSLNRIEYGKTSQPHRSGYGRSGLGKGYLFSFFSVCKVSSKLFEHFAVTYENTFPYVKCWLSVIVL